MLNDLISLDQSVFLALNGLHLPFLDQFFFYATKPLVWIPLYLVLLLLFIYTFRWKTILVIMMVALTITASDQLANLGKNSTQRLRPTHEPTISSQVHIVNNYKGGRYSFWSAHASTNMAVALFVIMLLRRRYRWIVQVMLLYAFIMGYSRIYLGVHYPGDILTGFVIGALLGWLTGWLSLMILSARKKNQ